MEAICPSCRASPVPAGWQLCAPPLRSPEHPKGRWSGDGQERVTMLVTPCIWWWGGGRGPGGTTWHRREALRDGGPPPQWWPGPPVLCLSSPDAWASLPTWCPEGVWSFFPFWQRPACCRSVSGGWGLEWGSAWARPPPALEVCEEFCVHGTLPQPPSPSHPFQNGSLTGLGWPEGQRGRSWKPQLCVCTWGPQPLAAGGHARGQWMHLCALVTAQRLHLLGGRTFHSTHSQGHVSAPRNVPTGLNLPCF